MSTDRLKQVTLGLLLTWRKLPEAICRLGNRLLQFVGAVLTVAAVVLIPFFFWVAPIIVLFEERDARKAAARRAARKRANPDDAEFWDDEL